MAFGDTYICPRCKALFVEDDQMWEDPHRCPKCGWSLNHDSGEENTADG